METHRFTNRAYAREFLVNAGFTDERARELLELAISNGKYGVGATEEFPHISMSYSGGQWAIKTGEK